MTNERKEQWAQLKRAMERYTDNADEIIEQLMPHIKDISYRTYYRKRREAIESLSCILWGYTEKESLTVLEQFFD